MAEEKEHYLTIPLDPLLVAAIETVKVQTGVKSSREAIRLAVSFTAGRWTTRAAASNAKLEAARIALADLFVTLAGSHTHEINALREALR